MEKTAVIFFFFLCLHQRAYLQSLVHATVHFTSAIQNRVAVDSLYNYSFSAKDSTGAPVSLSVKHIPAWLRFNKTNNSIYGKAIKAGQYMVDLAAASSGATAGQRFMLTVYDHSTTNILILGNSITNGTNKYNSYRRTLWQLLHTNRYNFDFIGSWDKHHMGGEYPNPDFDMDHDGHSGWKASDILQQPDWDKQRGNLTEWIKTYTPGMVLMELGTNEVFQCIPAAEAMNNIASIIDILRKKNPEVKIFIAQIPPLGPQWAHKKLCGNKLSYREAVIAFNKAVSLLVNAKNTRESTIRIVDQYSGINPKSDLYDDIHPNSVGEEKMAARWYKAIKKYLVKLT